VRIAAAQTDGSFLPAVSELRYAVGVERLTIYDGKEAHNEHLLQGEVVSIGRHPKNDVVLNDPTLSRFHARIERRQRHWNLIVEPNAQNGLTLNGQRLLGEKALKPGDKFQLGRFVVVFHLQPDDGALGSGNPRPYDDSESGPHKSAGSELADLLDEPDEPEDSAPVDREAAPTVLPQKPRYSDPSTAQGVPPLATPVSTAGIGGPALVVLHNGKEIARHALVGEVAVGRGKACGVVIPSMSLSRKHATVVIDADGPLLRDEGSRNGTWVNNMRVDSEHRLRDGDLVNFYEYGLLYLQDGRVALDLDGTGDVHGQVAAIQPSTAPLEPSGPNDLDLGHEDFGPGSLLVDEGVPIRPENDLLQDGLLDESGEFDVAAPTDGQLAKLANHTSIAIEGLAAWPNDSDVERALAVSIDFAQPTLVVEVGGRRLTDAPLLSAVTRIGSDPRCELPLPRTARVRPWHCTLLSMGGALVLHRLQKTSPVLLNGAPIDVAVLNPGDVISIGGAQLTLRVRR
jgi:pSer/pThr/pTyr-binding forkhead associated (FHA) protein